MSEPSATEPFPPGLQDAITRARPLVLKLAAAVVILFVLTRAMATGAAAPTGAAVSDAPGTSDSRAQALSIDLPAPTGNPQGQSPAAAALDRALFSADALIRTAELEAARSPTSERHQAIAELRQARAALYEAGRRALPPPDEARDPTP